MASSTKRQKEKTKKVKLIIHDDEWWINFLSPKVYKKKYNDNSGATTVYNQQKRQIDFNLEEIDKEVISHEVFHLLESYLCLEDVQTLEPEQVSEIYAVFNGRNRQKIDKLTSKIYKLYKAIK